MPDEDDEIPDVLTVRWSLSSRLMSAGCFFTVLVAVSAVMFSTLPRASPSQRAGAWIVAVLAAAVAVVQVARPRLTLTPTSGVAAVGLRATQALRWDDVVSVDMPWWSDRNGAGFHVRWKLRDGARLVGVLNVVLVADEDAWMIRRWMARHQPAIVVDPTVPWCDRFGVWHTESEGYDPVETIRSVRRAHVGPWEITAHSCDGGYRATWRDAGGGPTREESPVRLRLSEAISDAEAFVRAALGTHPHVR